MSINQFDCLPSELICYINLILLYYEDDTACQFSIFSEWPNTERRFVWKENQIKILAYIFGEIKEHFAKLYELVL